jgi:hypothetical protein
MKSLIALLIALAPTVAHADKIYLHGGKDSRWNCADDPVVYIRKSGGRYTFSGACKLININGGKMTITIESVETLAVNGDNNHITVGTLDSVSINGSDNTITYRTAKSSDVKSDAIGSNNTLLHIK